MGIDLMVNFRRPYLAVNPSDFWRRWHISLSTWLRDYVYISAGGKRRGEFTTNPTASSMLAMVLGGIWHGANWTFVAWGVFHGVLLCGYRVFDRAGRDKTIQSYSWFARRCRWIGLLQLGKGVGWLVFGGFLTAEAWNAAGRIVTNFDVTPLARVGGESMIFYAAPLFLFEAWLERRGDFTALLREGWRRRAAVYSYCLVMLVFFPPATAHEFIYFQIYVRGTRPSRPSPSCSRSARSCSGWEGSGCRRTFSTSARSLRARIGSRMPTGSESFSSGTP